MRHFLKLLLVSAILFAALHTHAAVLLNESGERYNLANDAANPTVPTTGSVCFWVYPNWASTDSVNHVFFMKETDANNIFGIQKFSDNKIYAGWFTSSVDHRVVINSGSFTLNQSAWNHVCLTWDDTANETRFYLNGSNIASQTSTLATHTSESPTLGSSGASATNPDARMGELGIWTRVLGGGEITSMNARFSALFFNSGLLYYPMFGIDFIGGGGEIGFRPRFGVTGSNARLEGNSGFTNSMIDHPPIIYPHQGR